ncbi:MULTISPECIES: DUF3048 domain-containing protein [Streptomyces]|uniref:DUF3048 domain-containing protein n=1 Tax=Streptomyces TaxID=1883 RepID=UPI001F0E6E38|nr:MULTISPECIES: DUF3048 domain-containing protein [Streptomyces]
MATVRRRRGARGRRATTAALLAAAVTAAVAAGCTAADGPGDDGRGSPKESKQDASPSATGPSALVVKIDNAAVARPHTGVDAADVVYAEQVEGGLSRLMAVYATRLPETVGPVRSARESDLELLRQFDRPTLAFSGAQKKLLPLIDKAPLRAETPGNAADAYFRGSGNAPHNLYLRPERIAPKTPGEAALTTGFHYGAAPAGGTATNSRTVRYPGARFTFTWSDSRDRWLVGMDGAPATTADGERMTAPTVVVQYVKVRESAFRDFLGNNTPYTETVGSGTAQVLRDGRAWDVNWKREKATDGTAFTSGDGMPVNFAKGPVWVVFAKAP